MPKNIKAVMMAGGFGTRIQPLTNSVPKPMLPIANLPMMEHILNKLIDVGIKEIVILLYFKPEVIKDYFGDGSKWGVTIHYVLPDDDYGTAGAVGFAREYLDTTFIIVSGDLVTDFDFKKMFAYHEKKKSKLTITLTSVENPLQFGVVIANEDGKIEKFLEKPSWGEVFSDTINTGLYVIEPEILDFIPEKENYDFAKDLFPALMEAGIDLMGFTAKGYWRDVGNPDSYRDVHDDILNERLNFKIPGHMVKYPDGKLYLTGANKIDKDNIDESVEIIGNVVIGENVHIGKHTKLNNVVIGNNVTIGSGGKIRNSIFWHDIKIGKNLVLDNAVVCNNNIIGDNVTAKAGIILAEGCKVGKLATFGQDVTIWPDKEIEAASIVSHNVVWGSRYKNSIFEKGGVIGKSNVELSCEMSSKLAEAYAAHLPIGAKVMVARDYNKSSRMLKRAFLGGLLSAGVNVDDLKSMPPAILRYNISKNPDIVGGAYFRQNLDDPTSTEITFFNEDGLRIDSNMAKTIEKSFFTEKFRRVDYMNIGAIHESYHYEECNDYKEDVISAIDHKIIKSAKARIAVDLMYGGTTDVFPQILTDVGIENIVLNSYHDAHKLANLLNRIEGMQSDISSIVKYLNLMMGIMIYPNGQRLSIVTDEGEVLDKIKGLMVVLDLLDMEAKSSNSVKKVFLPTWAPDIFEFDHLDIKRGKYTDFTAQKLKKYDLVATVDGNYAFGEFSLHRDAMYATLKIIELVSKHNVKLSDIAKKIETFYYKNSKIPCSQSMKGKMMRKFLEDAKDKKHSSADGVKIWTSKNDWILMIPDQYSDNLNLYLQAKDEKSGKALHDLYVKKIEEWMQ